MGPGHCLGSLPGASRSEGQLRLAHCWEGQGVCYSLADKCALSGRAGAGDGAGCSPLPRQQICPGSGSPDSCSMWLQMLVLIPDIQSSLAVH